MKYLVTGAAGFIGSSLVDRLLLQDHKVIGVDNLSTGFKKYIEKAIKNEKFKFINTDLINPKVLDGELNGVDAVFHLAANADIRGGIHNPKKDIEQNTLVTFYVLEAMRRAGVNKIVFASSAAVLGEPSVFPTPEDCPNPIQTSLYGASKQACEGLISAYCEGYEFEGYSFRFVSLLGPRYPHGHVYDFVNQLVKNPLKLNVLGNGSQRKSYMHIEDCLDAIIDIPLIKKTAATKIHNFDVYHLGAPEFCQVRDSVAWICDELNLQPIIEFGKEDRGWKGDNPFVFLKIDKALNAGWKPKFGIEQSIRITTRWLNENRWIFDERS